MSDYDYDDCSFGPVSSMPGSLHRVPKDACCDRHPLIKATRRVQGETDSMGCEYVLMCDACYEEHKVHEKAALEEERLCDWCRSMAKGCRPTRDYDEGMSGPVYMVCPACRTKQTEQALTELDNDDDWI